MTTLRVWKERNDRDEWIFSKAEESTEQLVIDLAYEKGISIRLYDKKPVTDYQSRAIIVMFKSRKLRNKFYEPRKQRVGLKFIIRAVCIACVSSVEIIELL